MNSPSEGARAAVEASGLWMDGYGSQASARPLATLTALVGGVPVQVHELSETMGPRVLHIGATEDCDLRLPSAGSASVEIMSSASTLLVRAAHGSGPVTLNGGVLWESWVPLDSGDALRLEQVIVRVTLHERRAESTLRDLIAPQVMRVASELTSHSSRQRQRRWLTATLLVAALVVWVWLLFHLD